MTQQEKPDDLTYLEGTDENGRTQWRVSILDKESTAKVVEQYRKGARLAGVRP